MCNSVLMLKVAQGGKKINLIFNTFCWKIYLVVLICILLVQSEKSICACVLETSNKVQGLTVRAILSNVSKKFHGGLSLITCLVFKNFNFGQPIRSLIWFNLRRFRVMHRLSLRSDNNNLFSITNLFRKCFLYVDRK